MAEGDVGGSDGPSARRGWKQNPEAVRSNILSVARDVFVANGLSGAKMDEIAALTRTSKRMIYYYFGDKEGLYRAVLEDAYARMRSAEDSLDLDRLHPVEALRRLAEFTFEHHRQQKDFVRLVMVENIHDGRHMSKSEMISGQNSSAIRLLDQIYRRGCDDGLFRRGLSALELHWHISAMAIFNVSNRATFSAIFGDDLFGAKGQQMLCRHAGDMLVRFVMKPGLSIEDSATPPRQALSQIHPDLLRFLDMWQAKVSELPAHSSAADRRLHMESVARDIRMPTPENIETDEEHWIETMGGPVRVRIFRHKGGGVQPALVYMHGGSWVQGSPESHWDITARIASWNRQTVISVDYALAPEVRFPAAFLQVVAVLRWVHDQARDLRIDPARIAVGGDSAGGNLAAAAALECRTLGLPICAQLLIYPVCDFDMTRPSYAENPDGPMLSVATFREQRAMYLPETDAIPTDYRHTPLAAESHAGLPPSFVATAQFDPLRDSGIAYADALDAAGVRVVRDTGEGMIHGYLRAMAYCPAAEARLRRMCDWLAQIYQPS
ncbi:TetR family transcriptional regulator [Pseudooceanicola sediminis]|uniref:TetR family transcriptional regulator n=1 Tax=Pseudooceanicola sediminis TaxID=2211117 RepID=A0A399IYQ5_9RHOB|nr:alpha/beta hydrolase fold domain-containing protein [Pseudooceanicola sediminis]KAA2316040.1 alpha/beta hydrolase fold domain-containing protein [Puniceibacterium sp. HSS470]RII38151.1 TetR family transcriptional regulator [Pseudooceanicola sediminis]